MSQTAIETRERVLVGYMHTLTSEDIKPERTPQAAQRKTGGSGKAITKDKNVPVERSRGRQVTFND